MRSSRKISIRVRQIQCHDRILATKSGRYTSFGDESPIAAMVFTTVVLKLNAKYAFGIAGQPISAGYIPFAS